MAKHLLIRVTDFTPWLDQEYWRLGNAVVLVCGYDPSDSKIEARPTQIRQVLEGQNADDFHDYSSNTWVLPCEVFEITQLARLTAYHAIKGFLNPVCTRQPQKGEIVGINEFIIAPRDYIKWCVCNVGPWHKDFVMPRDWYFPSALRAALSFSDLLDEFLKQGERYFSWWNMSRLQLGQQAQGEIDADFCKNYARKEMTECGTWLTPHLMSSPLDGELLLTFLHRIDAGGGAAKAIKIWEQLKVTLQKHLIQAKQTSTTPATAPAQPDPPRAGMDPEELTPMQRDTIKILKRRNDWMTMNEINTKLPGGSKRKMQDIFKDKVQRESLLETDGRRWRIRPPQ